MPTFYTDLPDATEASGFPRTDRRSSSGCGPASDLSLVSDDGTATDAGQRTASSVAVDDVDAQLDQVAKRGRRVLAPPTRSTCPTSRDATRD
jgi:hypothetical protein